MILILLILFNINIQAKSNNQLGLSFSTVSGTGINFNHNLNSKLNLELTSFYMYLGDKPPKEYETYFNIGGEIQYNIYKNNGNRTYIALASSYWDINQHYIKEIPSVNGSPKDKDTVNSYVINNYGLGFGNEFELDEHITFSISLLYQFQKSPLTNLSEIIDRNPKSKSFSGIGFGVSLRYRFR